MVADQVRDFLDHGHVRNAVNFSELVAPRQTAYRCACACAASQEAATRVSEALTQAGVTIAGLASASSESVTYVVADTTAQVPAAALERLASLEGVLMVRAI